MKRTIESNKIQRLQAELHMIDVANEVKNSHIFFVDDEEKAKTFDTAKHLNTHPALLNRRTNRPKLEDLAKMELPKVDPEVCTKNPFHPFSSILCCTFLDSKKNEKMP